MNEYEHSSPNLVDSSVSLVSKERCERSPAELFTDDLDELNRSIVDLLSSESADGAILKQAWLKRSILAEEFVNSLENTLENPTLRERVQFDIIVDKAVIFESIGNITRYLSELDSAEVFARISGLNDMADSVADEIEERIDDADDSFESIVLHLRGKISFTDREFIRDLIHDGVDREIIVDNIYNSIYENGHNPDDVLTKLVKPSR